MRFGILGPLEVTEDGQPRPITSPSQRALLTALLLSPDQVVSGDRLATALWGEELPASAVNSLQSHVARLRSALGDARLVVHEPPGYRLAVAVDDVDAEVFDHRLAGARGAPTAEQRLAELDAALGLWRGAALGEFADGFARGPARRLEQLRQAARNDRAAALIELGRFAEAIGDLERAMADDCLDEAACALLVRTLAGSGRIGEADAAYRRHREAVASELGLDPSPQLQALHTALLRGELAGTVTRAKGAVEAPAAPAAAASVLPSRSSSFVGREAETQRLQSLLASPGVVVVTGPGGVGKTRLVMQVLHEVDDPVRWVDVFGARRDADLVNAVAVAVGAIPQPDTDPLDAIAATMVGFPGILVIDNCEQVADATVMLVERIMARTPDARILATSQERLRSDGERVLALSPLAGPTPDGDGPAVALFLDRAGEALADDDAARLDAASLVGQLDGLPLEIELAATQVRALGLEGVRTRLRDRLDLLARGRRTEQASHRALRDVVARSHDLLSEDERRLFRRLAPFVGTFSTELAEAVVADDDLLRSRVAALLAALVDRSVVVCDEPGRFRLLDALRTFAGERLHEVGEGQRCRHRHAVAVVAAVEREDARLLGCDEAAAVAAIRVLLPDLRAAHAFALEAGEKDLLVRLPAALFRFGYLRQRYEVLGWGRDAPFDAAHPRLPAAVAAAATHAWGRGAVDEAAETCDRLVDVVDLSRLESLADDPGAAVAIASLHEIRSDVAGVRGDAAEALAAAEAQVHAGQAAGSAAMQATGLAGVAFAQAHEDRLEAAEAAARRGIQLAERCGSPSALAICYYTLGEAIADRDPEAAIRALETAAACADQVDNRLIAGASRAAVVNVRSRHGDPDVALRGFDEVLDHWAGTGTEILQVAALRNLFVLLARVGADADAAVVDGALAVAADQPVYAAEAARLARARASVDERLGRAEAAQLRRRGAELTAPQLVERAHAAIAAARRDGGQRTG